MPTKSQSPGPVSTATSSKPPAAGRARKKEQDAGAEATATGRAGSAGGVKLDKQQGSKTKPVDKTSATTAKAATPSPAKAAEAATSSASTGPNRQRRRPRKLNKEPAAQTASSATIGTTTIPTSDEVPVAATAELEALKSRVRGLEAKVEELYNSGIGDARNARSPRRRGKGKKASSSQQVPTLSSLAGDAKVEDEDEDEADEELVRLEGELEVARRDLESYHPRRRPRTKRSTSGESEYIEEIPRHDVGLDDTVNTGDRQVTLTGSYRIPLPTSVSMSDVKSIQSGVTAAQNVARSFLEQRRAQQSLNSPSAPTPQPSKPKARPAPTSSSTAVALPDVHGADGGGQTWSEWFGGYSMAISRAVKNIEADAALEGQRAAGTAGGAKRPASAKRTASAPSAKGAAKPAARAGGGGGGGVKAGQRPGMKARAANLSSEQVHGLLG